MTARRFPPPWTVEELDACFIVRDHNGQALAYVYAQSKSDRSPGTNHINGHRAARRLAHGRWRGTSVQCRDVRYGAHLGLMSDIARGPGWAISGLMPG